MIEIGPNLKDAIKAAFVVVPILAVFAFGMYCRKKDSEDNLDIDDEGYSVPTRRTYHPPEPAKKRKKKCRTGKCHHKHCKG